MGKKCIVDLQMSQQVKLNSEQRKEKSRDAARCRRSQETEIFCELAHELPVPYSLLSQLDKASIIRLAITHLKLRSMLATAEEEGSEASSGSAEMEQKLNQQYYKSLDGFLIVIAKSGDIVYISENAEKYLGLSQVDLLGYSIMDFVHPCDHEEMYELLNDKSYTSVPDGSLSLINDMLVTKHRSLFVRIKCTLTSKGRNINIKSAAYKVIHLTGNMGYRLPTLDLLDLSGSAGTMSECAVLVGRPMLNVLSGELMLNKWMFVSRHALDLKFVYCDPGLCRMLGYSQSELVGKSLFSFHHILDAEMLDKTFRALLSKGQAATGFYRFLTKHGGYVWMETSAALTGDESNERKDRFIICVNYVISNIEDRDTVFASIQLQDETLSTVNEVTEDIIEEDCNEVMVYKDEDEDDNVAGMQFVTEQIVTEQLLASKSNTIDYAVSVVSSVTFAATASDVLSAPSLDRSPMIATTTATSDIVLEHDHELNESAGGLRTLSGNSLSNFFSDLESGGIELRAPYVPLDDLTFVSSVVCVDEPAEHCPVELDLTTVSGSSTSTLAADTPTSADTSSTNNNNNNNTDSHVSVIKRSGVDTDKETVNSGDSSPSGGASPVYKLPRLADDMPTTATSRDKPVTTAVSSSSVLLNLLTKGIDTNWGYKLKDCLAQSTAEVSSDGASSSSGSDSSGVVFVSLVQNLINVEQSASGLDRSNLPPDDVFLSTQ